MMVNKLSTDVLIIGAGGAGIRAAIEASDNGAEVLLVTKKKVGYSGSTFYPLVFPWGIMTSGNDDGSNEEFLNEILNLAGGVIDKKLVEILVINSNDRLSDLKNYGMKFTNCSDTGVVSCFGKKPRGFELNSIENARGCFKKQINKRNIKVIENLYIADLIVKENICYGAFGFDRNEDLVIIYTKTVILATGGAENLFKYNVVTSDVVGDGYSMAAKLGARIVNLEFIQFTLALTYPKKAFFWHISLDSVAKVLNKKGEEFLPNYLPENITTEDCLIKRASHGPFSSSDISKYFDIAICKESEKEENYSPIGAKIIYPELYFGKKVYLSEVWINWCLSIGIDLTEEDIIVYPHCQGFNGGILINEHCETDIENVFACGEVAGGVHGADRIGGNAILATQVFGKIAGEEAAKRAHTTKLNYLNNISDNIFSNLFDTGNNSKLDSKEILEKIREIMSRSAGIIRDGHLLGSAIDEIECMKREFNPCQQIKDKGDIRISINAYNALVTCTLILKSIFLRKESRGAHYRKDYPKINDRQYRKMNHIRLNNDGNIISKFV